MGERAIRTCPAGWYGVLLAIALMASPLYSPAWAQTPQAPPPGQPAAPAPATPPAQAAPLGVSAQRPEPGALIVQRKPLIGATLADPGAVDPKSVMVEIDGVDVTSLAKVEDGKIVFVPPADLKHGEHTVKVSASDATGTALAPVEWKFKIRRFARIEDLSFSGELSSTYEGAVRKPKKEPIPDTGAPQDTETPVHNLTSNLSVRGLLKEGELTAKLDANLRYADDFRPRPRPKEAAEKLDIANYLIGVERRPFTFELGDILVNEGFYAAPNLSRRGMHLVAKDESVGAQMHLFGTRYESTSGHDPFFGPEESDSVLFGGAVAYSPFADKELLRLHGVTARGHRFSSEPGSNVGTIVSGERGEVWSFGTSSTFFGGKLKLLTEIAFSEFDTNITDEVLDQADKAYRVRLEGTQDLLTLFDAPVSMKWGTEYAYVGFAFRSPGNPGIQPDREGWNAKSDFLWNIATVSLGYSATNDNTDRLALIPRVRTFAWNSGIALAPPELPTIGYNYNRGDQRSFYEPESHGNKGVDNVQNTHTLNVGYGKEKWNASVGLTANFFDDKRQIVVGVTGGDKDTYSAQGNLTLKLLPSLTLTPGLNWTVIDEKNKAVILASGEQSLQRVRAETITGTLTIAQEIIAKVLNLDLQASGASSQSSDSTVDNQTWSGVGRVTWNLGSLFWDYGKQAVSLRVNWNRTLDHLVPRDTNEIGAFLILDLLAPYNF